MIKLLDLMIFDLKKLLITSTIIAATSISNNTVADIKVSGEQENLDAGGSFKSTLGSSTGA